MNLYELEIKYAEVEREYQSKKYDPLIIMIGVCVLIYDILLIKMYFGEI